MIAGMPMYAWPATAAAEDRLWVLIRDGLRDRAQDAPDRLSRGVDVWSLWQDPALVLAQTCGLPFRARLHDRVTLIGTPDYGLPDSPPGHYHSVVVARRGAPNQAADRARLAYNDGLSQSGWAAALAHAGGRAFAATLATGSHRESARAVAEGRADLAAIDAVTWRMLGRWDTDLTDALTVIDRTPTTPGLPLIAAPGRDAEATFAAVADAIDTLDEDDSDVLGLRGLVAIPAATYLAMSIPPAP